MDTGVNHDSIYDKMLPLKEVSMVLIDQKLVWF